MGSVRASSTKPKRTQRPAVTLEGRENQLVAMAMDCAEEQLQNRTASSQVIAHFLKLGTVRAQLELEKLKQENMLLEAKRESIQSAARSEELYSNALNAMRRYSGQGSEEEDDGYDYDDY